MKDDDCVCACVCVCDIFLFDIFNLVELLISPDGTLQVTNSTGQVTIGHARL